MKGARVIHATWDAGFGGIARLVLDLVNAQQRLGLKVSVLMAREEGELLKAIRSAADELYIMDLSSGYDFAPGKIRRASAVLREHDILNLHSYIPAVVVAARRAGIPVVFTDHGNFGQGRKLGVADAVKRIMMKRFFNRRVSHIAFNSAFTRRESEARYGLQAVSRSIIYNGVNFAARNVGGVLDPETVSRLAGKFVVGTCSRFNACKRLDRLIDGFAEFHAGKDTLLMLVGDGDRREEYTARVMERGIQHKTLFTGYQDDVVPFQRAMNVCVFPSQLESFGLVAVECMSLGKPTIVFADGGGVTEVVMEIEPANVVNSVSGLVNRLETLYSADSTDHAAQARLYTDYAAGFSLENMSAQLAAVYQKVLGE